MSIDREDITVELLISTMHQTDHHLVKKMNIFTDAVVINQCGRTGYEEFQYNGHTVRWFDSEERGVGKSRNMALIVATADICVFADDDMVYDDDALQAVMSAFTRLGDAAMVIFNVRGLGKEIDGTRRLHIWNASRYGTFRMAVWRSAIMRARISFSLLFGGGAKYSCGEDSLFISDCLRHHLKLYAVPDLLGTNLGGESTWFKGYTKKYFIDRGVLFAALNPYLAELYCVRFVLLRGNMFRGEVGGRQALKWMLIGVANWRAKGMR